MKNKVLIVVLSVLYIFFMYLIQLYLIDNNDIFGVKPNIILVTCVVFTLIFGIYKGTAFSFLVGCITDLLFTQEPIFIVIYTLCALVVGLLENDTKNDNIAFKVAVIFSATATFEVIQYIFYAVKSATFFNIFYLLKQIMIASMLNVAIGFLVLKLIDVAIELSEIKNRKNMSGF